MKRKYLALVLSCALVASVTVVGTLAYLNEKTEEVTNTFTFCDEKDGIHLDLKETVFGDKYDPNGLNEGSGDEVVANMVPGATIAKNPMVKATGADCYLFIDVTIANNFTAHDVPFYFFELSKQLPEGYTWELVNGLNDETEGGTANGTASYVLSKDNHPVVVKKDTEYAILNDLNDKDHISDYTKDESDTAEINGAVTINTALTADDLETVEKGTCEKPSLSFVAYAVQSANIESGAVEQLFIDEFKDIN